MTLGTVGTLLVSGVDGDSLTEEPISRQVVAGVVLIELIREKQRASTD